MLLCDFERREELKLPPGRFIRMISGQAVTLVHAAEVGRASKAESRERESEQQLKIEERRGQVQVQASRAGAGDGRVTLARRSILNFAAHRRG